MAVSIKNKDSVTGIVLYIFNLLQQYKDMSASIEQGDLIKFLNVFDKSESAARMGLSRMSNSKVIEKTKKNSSIYYKLDKEGKEYLNIWIRGYEYFNIKFNNRQNKQWDDKWHSFILNDFNKTDKSNEKIIEELIELGKCEVEYNVWLSPYDVSDIIKTLLERNDISYFNISGKLNTDKTIEKILEDIYDLRQLEEEYEQVLAMIKKYNQIINKNNPAAAELLPMLGYTGWLFYTIITKDPFLPKDILSEWIGDKTVNKFRRFRADIFRRITEELF
jgi:phenylacetic acid degradation operon negative regulatory protein